MSDTSFIERIAEESSSATEVIKDVRDKVRTMIELEAKMMEAELIFKEAKKRYEHYKDTVVITSMTNAGIYSLEDMYGNIIKLEQKFYCSPNKNLEDQQIMNDWLKEHGGEYLTKHSAEVDEQGMEQLLQSDIPFIKVTSINTNSLKSFLKDLLGYNGGIAKIDLDDIPSCFHFYIKHEVVAK